MVTSRKLPDAMLEEEEGLAMAYRFEHPAYKVEVDGEFAGERRWRVRAVVRYADGLGTVSIERLAPEARFELMHGIIQENRRGLGLGARSAHVLVEGDRETAEFLEGIDRRRKARAS